MKYLSTCYIDKHNELGGKLYIGNEMNLYIDFDMRCIYINNERKFINPKAYQLLTILIRNGGIIIPKEDLEYDLFFEYSGENDIGLLRNKARDLRKIDARLGAVIITAHKTGYGFFLGKDVKIIKIAEKRENISNIDELFENISQDNLVSFVDYKNSPDYEKNIKKLTKTSSTRNKKYKLTKGSAITDNKSPLADNEEISSKFIHSGATRLLHESGDKIYNEMIKMSSVFLPISTLKNDDVYITFDNIIADLYNIVTTACKKNEAENILKIKGPSGSYKNRILEYMFLAISKRDTDILPFYVNVSQYEKRIEDDNVTEEDVKREIENDFNIIADIISKYDDKIPLLFLDSIRDFSVGSNHLYSYIAKIVKELNAKIVVSLDANFTMNRQRRFKIHPLANNTFSYFLRIKSMDLHDKNASSEYIKNCIEVFNIPVAMLSGDTIEKKVDYIYNSFVNMNLISLDAFWLANLLKVMSKNVYNPNYTISDLYELICIDFLGDETLLDSTIEMAYEFEYGSSDLKSYNVFFDIRWRLIRRHRSILEYLIARKYISMLYKMDFNQPHEVVARELKFFNMVLQKTITRFVVTMLGGIDDYEHKILLIAKDYYDDLSLFGKSELTFWLGRLRNAVRKKESVKYLKQYKEIELAKYDQDDFDNIIEKRYEAFIVRGIVVSLIYEGDKSSLIYYLNSLLTDKIANSVNRGFHLEYYGDKPYIPNKSLLDFEDDVKKGEKTMSVLCLSLDKKKENKEIDSYVALIELITLCNLIQARLESSAHDTSLNSFSNQRVNLSTFIKKCISYLKWVKKFPILNDIPKVRDYFSWMLTELNRVSHTMYHKSDRYNLYSNATEVKRTGWVLNKVKNPENIVEHMYKCWLLGMLYLPDEYDDDNYSKENILQMLLLHDLGETVTGDINRPDKQKDYEFYKNNENSAMNALFFSGTYPLAPNLNKHMEYWTEWYEGESINYMIAKDIDNIQTIYQYCEYYLSQPELFDDASTEYWLKGTKSLNTAIGKQISDTLIINNPKFASFLK